MRSDWPDRLAWTMLALVALIAALTFRDYGLGWDDFAHAQYGDLLLKLYGSGLRDRRALGFVNLYLYGGGFDMAAALLAKIAPFGLFETRRLLGAIVGVIGLLVTWRIGRRIGGPVVGLAALVLLATCPLYYGHMFINPKDAPFATAMALFLLGLVRAFEQYPKPSWPTVVLLGLGFGLSIGSRVLAGFGVLEALLALALLVAIEARSGDTAFVRLGRLMLRLLPAAVLAYAVMALVWPWSVTNPLNPIAAIEIFSHFFEKPWQELFGGELLTPLDMPRSYVPVLFALKLPEIFTLLALAGLLGALIVAARAGSSPQRRAIHLGIALAALVPVAVTVIARPAMYNGVRHFVFVLPPLAVAGGLAAGVVFERAARHGRAILVVAIAVFLGAAALPVIDMVRLHPYQYASFNHLAGGVRAAQHRYMLDYWGLASKQAGETLQGTLASRAEVKPPGRKWKIAVCGPHPPAQVALGDEFEPTWDPKGADFALSLGTFYCAHLDAPVLAEVVRDGVVFARAYDLRGRNVETLFGQPPLR